MSTALTETNGTARRQTVMGSLSERYSMDPGKLLDTIKATCIKGNATNEQVQAFLIVANRYGLDPFLKEIHAFASQGGGIVPIVGIDGWSKIANSTGKMNGVAFEYTGSVTDGDLACTCSIRVKDYAEPVSVTEYLTECKKNSPPWNQWPRRMLRHRAFMQCARLAFGLGGIYDEDEAHDILDNTAPTVTTAKPIKSINDKMVKLPEPEVKTETTAQETVNETTGEIIEHDAEHQGESVGMPNPCPINWINDQITTLKPDHLTAHAARKAFHAADTASWENLPRERQDEKYAQLASNSFPWSPAVPK